MSKEFYDGIDYILKKSEKEFDDVIAHGVISEAKQIKFTNNAVSTGKVWEDRGVNLFVAKDQKLASTLVKELDKKSVNAMVKKLARFVKLTKPNNEYVGIDAGKSKYKKIQNSYDPSIPKLNDELVDLVEAGVNGALSKGAERCGGIIESGWTKEYLRTSAGIKAKQKGTSASFSIRAFASKDASGHKLSCARSLHHFKPEDAGKRAGETARQALDPAPGKPGKYNVMFDPMAFAVFLDHVGDAASMFSVEAGYSFMEGRLNRRVASDQVTLHDDPLLAGGMFSTSFDAEGRQTRRHTVIRSGILRTFLHNTSTAARYNTDSTSNAGIIAPHAWNLVLDTGSFELPEMLREVKDGLYVTNVWYMRFQNYKTGDFSVIPRDAIFKVKNGQIEGAVKDLRISDNMKDIMLNVYGVGKHREQIHGWEVETPVKTAPVLVKHVKFTKSLEK